MDRRKRFAGRILSIMQNTKPLQNRGTAVLAVCILGVWLAAVVFTETHHEFWRDEVRPLSLAEEAHSPIDLYRLEKDDGHPMLWYLILYGAYSIVHNPLVLPAVAIGVGFLAVVIFLFFAPMPFWLKVLFLFSAIPFYEYSVMARNYGISMLLMFVAAVLYPHREKLGLLLALTLAALANTNAHSIVFTGLIAAVWMWDAFWMRRAELAPKRWIFLGCYGAVIALGILISAVSVIPRDNTILTPIRQSFNLPDFFKALADSALHPEATLDRIMPKWVPPAAAAFLFFLAILGLLFRPPLFLAALTGEIALGLIFRLVYSGYYRHQALFIVFLLFLYWLYLQWRNGKSVLWWKNVLFYAGFYVAIPLIVTAGVWNMRDTVLLDIRMEMSSSKALGEFLRASSEYRNAILLPEPDYTIEPLAYYADNEIYLPREHRFSKTVSWTTESDAYLSLDSLMNTARELQGTLGKPVLIVLEPGLFDFSRPGEREYSYDKVFAWDAESVAEFQASTALVGEFTHSLEDENYLVYALQRKPAAFPPSGNFEVGKRNFIPVAIEKRCVFPVFDKTIYLSG
jgi:hypothetical protein